MALGWATTAWLGDRHQRIGYATLAFVALRLLWSRIGPRRAHLSLPAGGTAAIWRYARLAATGLAPRHVGHNPLGTCMAIAFFACVAALVLTGWLYTPIGSGATKRSSSCTAQWPGPSSFRRSSTSPA